VTDTDRFRGAPFWVALLLLVLSLVLAIRGFIPPAPLPLDAPAKDFSGLRAAEMLARLLGDETPHPVGSAANHAVRDRLLEMLTELGLEPDVQRAIGCSQRYPICANVENVVAEIPGETTDALVLMAHYDSVPHAPGAADDGAGVVTLLESARALLTEPRRRNRILLVFTDAEEMGLLGAEAFFAEHPLVASVKAVINVEGSGSGGPSLLLRSSSSGGQLVRAYRSSATSPVATSYSQEVFARMPNDTDFTVSDRAGIASIDFAFGFEFNHYHTPLDTLANLDKRTLQHHGDNVLPLARALAGTDLSLTEPSFAYLTVGQRLWVAWPVSWTLGFAVLAMVMVAAAAVRAAMVEGWKQLGGGTLLGLAAILMSAGTCFAALWIAGRLVGTTVDFPGNPWPWRLLMLAGAVAPASLLCWWAQQRIGFWPRYLGAWILLAILAMTLAIGAPLAANLLLVPVLIAALAAVLVLFLPGADNRLSRSLAAGVALVGIANIMLGIAFAMDESQGLGRAPVIYANLALLTPALLAFRSGGRTTVALLAVLPVAWIWAALSPLYSAWRPQHVSLVYVADTDTQQAYWAAISANPLPERINDAMGPELRERTVLPWVPESELPSTLAPMMTAAPPPTVTTSRDGQRVHIVVQATGASDFIELALPSTAGISDLSIDGHRVEPVARGDYVRCRLYAGGTAPVSFELTTATSAPVEGFVVDGRYRLPPAADPILASRGSLAVPQHQGDLQLVYRRVRL